MPKFNGEYRTGVNPISFKLIQVSRVLRTCARPNRLISIVLLSFCLLGWERLNTRLLGYNCATYGFTPRTPHLFLLPHLRFHMSADEDRSVRNSFISMITPFVHLRQSPFLHQPGPDWADIVDAYSLLLNTNRDDVSTRLGDLLSRQSTTSVREGAHLGYTSYWLCDDDDDMDK